jgi:hypothetical protein
MDAKVGSDWAKASMKPGGGGRFAALRQKIEGEGKSPAVASAIAASAGRKKYGASKMSAMAVHGLAEKMKRGS